MVSVLDSGSSSPGRALAVDIALSSWARHLPLSTRVYKWVLAYLMLGEALHAMDWHPIQGGVELLLVAPCYIETGDKRRPDRPRGLLGEMSFP